MFSNPSDAGATKPIKVLNLFGLYWTCSVSLDNIEFIKFLRITLKYRVHSSYIGFMQVYAINIWFVQLISNILILYWICTMSIKLNRSTQLICVNEFMQLISNISKPNQSIFSSSNLLDWCNFFNWYCFVNLFKLSNIFNAFNSPQTYASCSIVFNVFYLFMWCYFSICSVNIDLFSCMV